MLDVNHPCPLVSVQMLNSCSLGWLVISSHICDLLSAILLKFSCVYVPAFFSLQLCLGVSNLCVSVFPVRIWLCIMDCTVAFQIIFSGHEHGKRWHKVKFMCIYYSYADDIFMTITCQAVYMFSYIWYLRTLHTRSPSWQTYFDLTKVCFSFVCDAGAWTQGSACYVGPAKSMLL
jgi:hypothetical protein